MSLPARVRFLWHGIADDVTTGVWTAAADPVALMTSLQDFSGASILGARATSQIAIPSYNTPTSSALSAALLYFTTGAGTTVPIVLPGASGIYCTDGETVDSDLAADLITQVKLAVTDNAGNAVTGYSRGWAIRLLGPPLARP
jgi:hypothetical protein